MIDKLRNIFQERFEDGKIYFSEKKEEIFNYNLIAYKRLSVISLIGFIVYIILVRLISSEWNVTPFHIMLIVWLVIHIFVAFYISKHRLKNEKLEKAAIVLFGLCLYLLLICIDTVASPSMSQVICSTFLVVAPTIFIMKSSRMICDQIVFVLLYAFFAFRFKEHTIAVHDMYAILTGFCMGIISYVIITDLRLRVNSEVIRLKHFSEIDELTKIKNRRAANAQISYTMDKRTEDSKCALLILDVDLFKDINDTYGHKIGDQVLAEVAKVLSGTFRKTDVVSRFGGDEFLVFVDGFKEEGFLKEKCLEIEKGVSEIMKDEVHVSCSIGVCIQLQGDHSMEEMLHEADKALYETKEKQRGTHSINILD